MCWLGRERLAALRTLYGEWMAAIAGCRENPLATCLARATLRRKRTDRSFSLLRALELLLGALAVGALILAGVEYLFEGQTIVLYAIELVAPWQELAFVGCACMMALYTYAAIVRILSVITLEPHGAASGAAELIRSSALTDAEAVVGILRIALPSLFLASLSGHLGLFILNTRSLVIDRNESWYAAFLNLSANFSLSLASGFLAAIALGLLCIALLAGTRWPFLSTAIVLMITIWQIAVVFLCCYGVWSNKYGFSPSLSVLYVQVLLALPGSLLVYMACGWVSRSFRGSGAWLMLCLPVLAFLVFSTTAVIKSLIPASFFEAHWPGVSFPLTAQGWNLIGLALVSPLGENRLLILDLRPPPSLYPGFQTTQLAIPVMQNALMMAGQLLQILFFAVFARRAVQDLRHT
jgi:hypothetical protein